MHHLFVENKNEGGGACILLQDHYESINSTDITDLPIEHVVEVCATELPDKILLISMYWNGRDNVFDKQEKVIINHINNTYSKHNRILGDINVLHHTDLIFFLILCQSINFTQHIKNRTRLKKCIGLIFTNYDKNVISTAVKDFGFCDLKGVIINLKVSLTKKDQIW